MPIHKQRSREIRGIERYDFSLRFWANASTWESTSMTFFDKACPPGLSLRLLRFRARSHEKLQKQRPKKQVHERWDDQKHGDFLRNCVPDEDEKNERLSNHSQGHQIPVSREIA